MRHGQVPYNAAGHPLYQEALALMQKEAALPTPTWRKSAIRPADLQVIRRESNGGPFDRLNLRNEMSATVAEGRGRIFAHESAVGRIITLTDLPYDPTPLREWGRIMRLFGKPPAGGRLPQILWFAARQPRHWPAHGQPAGPEHINGGYCMACQPDTVVIYRYEDATRVLIHELLHGFCTDLPMGPGNSLEQLESATEAWAEIMLAAGREVGVAAPRPVRGALAAQLQWTALQNLRLRRDHGVRGPADYSWRYTVGKEDALRALGFSPYIRKYKNVGLRLTPPIGRNEVF